MNVDPSRVMDLKTLHHENEIGLINLEIEDFIDKLVEKTQQLQLLRPIYNQIAENQNAEIFSANTLFVILGTSLLTAREKFVNLCSQVESQPQSSESGDNGSCTQPKPIDYDALMIEVVGGRNAKGRVYGLGLDGRMCAGALTSKSKQYANYTDIVRSMSNEVEARLRQKIAKQQQAINRVLARQNKMLSFFAKHVNIDSDAMDLDEDDRSIGDTTHGSNPANDTDADDQY